MAKTLTTAELDALERYSAPKKTLTTAELDALATGAPKKTLSTAELDAMEQASAPVPTESGPMWESALRGFSQGATLGFGDEIQAGIRAAKQKLTGEDTRPYGEVYTSLRDQERAANAASATDNPVTHFVSNLVGGVPSAIAGGGSVKAAATVGGVTGLGSSSGDITDAAIDTTTGAVLGGGLQKALSLPIVGKTLGAVKRGVGEAVGRFADDMGISDLGRSLPVRSIRELDPEFLRAGRAAKDAQQDIVAVDKARQAATQQAKANRLEGYTTGNVEQVRNAQSAEEAAREAALTKLAGLKAKRSEAIGTRDKAMAEVDKMKEEFQASDVARLDSPRAKTGAIRAGAAYLTSGVSLLEPGIRSAIYGGKQAAEGWRRSSALPEKAVRPAWAAIMDLVRSGSDSVKAAQDMYVAQETDPEARKRLAGKE